MNPKLKNIDHIHIFVTDRQEALKWYENVLGLKPIRNLLFWAKTGPLTIGNEEGSFTTTLPFYHSAIIHCSLLSRGL